MPHRAKMSTKHTPEGVSYISVFPHGGTPLARSGGRRRFGSFWLVLALTSVPLHLVFNSAIFVTDRRESKYALAIVSGGFVHGDQYFPPGASLSPPGALPVKKPYALYGSRSERGYGADISSMRWGGGPDDGYTLSFTNLTQTNLTYTASNAAGWLRLDREACVKEYITCRGLRKYRNLAIVIKKKGYSWARNDVWDPGDVSSHMWDEMIPADQDNSLWYSAQCKMLASYRIELLSWGETKLHYQNTC